MKLSANLHARVKSALEDALGLDEAKEVTRPGLDQSWEQVFPENSTLPARVDALIECAEERDRCLHLIQAVFALNSTNAQVNDLIADHLADLQAPRAPWRPPIPGPPTWYALAIVLGVMFGGVAGYAVRAWTATTTQDEAGPAGDPWEAALARYRVEKRTQVGTELKQLWPGALDRANQFEDEITRSNRLAMGLGFLIPAAIPRKAEKTRLQVMVGASCDLRIEAYRIRGGAAPSLVFSRQNFSNPATIPVEEVEEGDQFVFLVAMTIPKNAGDAQKAALGQALRTPNWSDITWIRSLP